MINSEKTYVTVVPVYKTRPSKTEAFSFMQLRLLGIDQVTLMCPVNLDTSYYEGLFPEIQIMRFADNHFLSVQTYNDFLLQPEFYKTFSDLYEWLLIYQLDAFIFENRIHYFCNLDYDYYGAPWKNGISQYHFLFNRYRIKLGNKKFYVGNGGFSLRKLKTTIDLLERKRNDITKKYFMEDVFFGYWGSKDLNYQSCSPEIAAEFSVETHPDYWVNHTGKFPMGTHNFHRTGPEWGNKFYNPILKKCYERLLRDYPILNQLQEKT